MLDTTRYTWIIPERASAAHLRGVIIALDALGAVENADVRIMTVSETQGVALPAGIPMPDGSVSRAGFITAANIPKQGILFQGDLG